MSLQVSISDVPSRMCHVFGRSRKERELTYPQRAISYQMQRDCFSGYGRMRYNSRLLVRLEVAFRLAEKGEIVFHLRISHVPIKVDVLSQRSGEGPSDSFRQVRQGPCVLNRPHQPNFFTLWHSAHAIRPHLNDTFNTAKWPRYMLLKTS